MCIAERVTMAGLSFGEWLKRRRNVLGLTQAQLAQQLGCSTIALRKIEAEDRRPSAQIVERLADVFNIAPNERSTFLRFARGDWQSVPSAPSEDAAWRMSATRTAPHLRLPVQLTSFIGREKEIAAVKELVTSQRLTTLTGAGGTGKTRLGQQVAAALFNEFDGGVWWVELASLSDPATVSQAVAATLGVREEIGRSIDDILIDSLCGSRCLLVLDNCEHLIAACAQLVVALLRACPRLSIVATSRETLGIAGEALFPVPSLMTPDPGASPLVETLTQYDSVRLFIERAKMARSSFALTESNAGAIAHICYQLDGIPLAIELAAARLKLLSAEQIVTRLDDRFRLLTGGGRTVYPRHQTMQATIDWSYELLTQAEQVLLCRLSVFAGGWTVEAAEMVGAGNGIEVGDVLDLLQRLVDKSLAITEQHGNQPRFRMLETIRRYANHIRLASDDSDRVRTCHLNFYLQLAEESAPKLFGSEQAIWINRLETEYPNLRAALEWSDVSGQTETGLRLAGALSYFWYWRLYIGDGRRWLERMLAVNGGQRTAPPAVRAKALLWLGEMERMQGDYTAACPHLEESQHLFQELGDTGGAAEALRTIGIITAEEGRYTDARALLEQSLALQRALNNKPGLALVLNGLGEVARAQDDYGSAERFYVEALGLYREVGDEFRTACFLQNLGYVALAQGDYILAQARLLEALSRGQQVMDAGMSLLCLIGFAGVIGATGDPRRAVTLLGAVDLVWGALDAEAPFRAIPLDFADRITYERTLAMLRVQLDDTVFAAAWAEGRAMTLEQAIADALNALSPAQTLSHLPSPIS